MGLMICQNLVKMNDGTIEVHSEGENRGSVFAFSMKMKSKFIPIKPGGKINGDATGGTQIPTATDGLNNESQMFSAIKEESKITRKPTVLTDRANGSDDVV